MQSDFSRWTVAALGAELSARGLSKAGLRGELIERLGQDETEKSKKRKAPTDNDELLTSLECPICMDRIMPPFEQCTNGHVICGVCKPSVLKSSNPLCPECRVSLLSLSRNLLMEKVVSGLTAAKTSAVRCTFRTLSAASTNGARAHSPLYSAHTWVSWMRRSLRATSAATTRQW